jgi:hypothetical protein
MMHGQKTIKLLNSCRLVGVMMKQCLLQKEAAAEVGISRGRLNRMNCFCINLTGMQNLSINSSERRPGHEINERKGVTFT